MYFSSLINSLTKRKVILISVLLISSFVLLRVSFGGFNFSHFVVAGSDFVVKDSLHPNLIINEGQGYDGQFFYRYAHSPLDTSRFAYGVTVDHIEYRIQRILYPTTVWLFSLGGKYYLPFWLVISNLLAFIGIIYLFIKIGRIYKLNSHFALFPLFAFGAYMSLARDTSELFEAFFFVLAIYYFIRNNILLYTISILLAIFSRETSLIAIGPLTLLVGLKLLKNNKFDFKLIAKGLLLATPFLLILLWKFYLKTTINSDRLVDGSHNLSYPIYGIIYGAKHNFNLSDFKSIFETIFWYLFLIWNIWFVFIVIKSIEFKELKTLTVNSILSIVFLFWTLFSLILGPAIYVDDWGFVRIFTLWNLLGFTILMLNKKSINKLFMLFSIGLLFLLLVRLIIRV
jgi:hypothetical protein